MSHLQIYVRNENLLNLRRFRSIGNIGDVLIRTGEIEEAAKMYQRQLTLARQYRERTMEATSYGALGLANRLMKKFDKALGYHTQELTLRQEICDMLGNFSENILRSIK